MKVNKAETCRKPCVYVNSDKCLTLGVGYSTGFTSFCFFGSGIKWNTFSACSTE